MARKTEIILTKDTGITIDIANRTLTIFPPEKGKLIHISDKKIMTSLFKALDLCVGPNGSL